MDLVDAVGDRRVPVIVPAVVGQIFSGVLLGSLDFGVIEPVG